MEAYEPEPVLPDPIKKFDMPAPVVEPSVSPIEDIDIKQIRKNIGFSHDITSMVIAAAGLPEDLTDVIDVTTEERGKQINKNFELAVERFNHFVALWREKQSDNASDEEVED